MSHIRSTGALIFGLMCLSGTIIVLFGHIRSIDDLTITHLYIALALTVTLGSGHFMWDAYSSGWWGVARGVSFTLLFIVGTVVCVGLSGARSAAIIANNDFKVDQNKNDIAKARARADIARNDKDATFAAYQAAQKEADADQQIAASECRTGKGKLCEGKQLSAMTSAKSAQALYERANDAKQAYNDALKALDAIKPLPPPNEELRPFALLYAWATHTPIDHALDVVKLLLPYAFSLITEFGTVAFFQHAFGPSTSTPSGPPTVTIADIAQRLSMSSEDARKTLRTLNVAKPSHGWAWTAQQAKAIQAQIEAHRP